MAYNFLSRAHRWIRYDGWRGSLRRGYQFARYWRFRALVGNLRKNAGMPPQHPETAGVGEAARPLLSILLVAFRTEAHWLRQAVGSVRTQDFTGWELCIGFCEVDGGLREEMNLLAESDPRIRLTDLGANLGIAGNTNRVAECASGEFLAVLDHDDYLEPGALGEIAALARSEHYDLIYTDEHIVTPRGVPLLPMIKPDWAPESLLSFNYICHFCCFRAALFAEVGGFHAGFEGAQDYDLFLRLTEKATRIGHVPKVLYNWRRHAGSTSGGGDAKPAAWEAGRRAVESHFQRTGQRAVVELGEYFGTLRVQPLHSETPAVEIRITPADRKPETDGRAATRTAADHILAAIRYPNLRVVCGDAILLDRTGGSGSCEIVIFLDARVTFSDERWVEGLLAQILQPGVGAVGPLLIAPDGTIAHAGLAVDPEEISLDFHRGLPAHSGGYSYRAGTIQNVSAVGPHCLCTRRDLYDRLGGFDPSLPPDYAAVDYCLRLAREGLRCVYTPWVRGGFDSDCGSPDSIGSFRVQAREKMRKKWKTEGLRERYFDTRILRPGADLNALAAEYLSIRA